MTDYQKKCRTFRSFVSKIEPLVASRDTWIFRGQRKAKWSLKTNLERQYERFGVEGDDRVKIEKLMIREFQRRLHQYSANVPNENNWDEWMALMQHHGAPTRLLDFTYSPYIAAYFAFENSKAGEYVAIWAVNTDALDRQLEDTGNWRTISQRKKYTDQRDPKAFQYLFLSTPPRQLVLAVNPHRLNERLTFQKGVFLCPGDIRIGFMENLTEYNGHENGSEWLKSSVIEYVIPTGKRSQNRDDALKTLDRMNISNTTLFPGLDGFARSFSVKIHTLFKEQIETFLPDQEHQSTNERKSP